MFVFAGTVAAGVLILGTLIVLDRSRSRQAEQKAEAVLVRARRRVAGQRAALDEVARAADRIYRTSRTESPSPDTPPTSTSPAT